MDRIDTPAPPAIGLGALFLKFLRFGCLAFGGPVAQIAMLRHQLVDTERWIDSARFNRLLAVMQVLPGPEAHELCVHMGMLARGRIGGLLAGLGFMLPGLVLMLAAASAYVGWVEARGSLPGLLLAVQIAVVGVIARAVWRIGRHVIEDAALAVIAGASLAATLIGVPFWLPLIAGGLAYGLAARRGLALAVLAVAIAVAALTVDWSPGGDAANRATPASTGALFIAGLKGGLLTFGGAYTAIPYVRADTVGRGWISDASFLDGVAVAGMLPAPLVIFATFAGYVAAGPTGALAITAGMFLPAFAFSLIFFERLEAIVEAPALRRALAGVAAAAVGIIAATTVQLGTALAPRLAQPLLGLAILVLATVAAWRLKGGWVTPAILAAAAVAGMLLRP